MADQDDRAGVIRPARGTEQIGNAGADTELGFDLERQSERFSSLQRSLGRTRQCAGAGA